ncbi:putative exo-beta-1,3-glucanase [Phyllosticta citrichinensis]|uniref:Exo-beta-1,3-glucanase n=1 Tax=Phyllosticta citrichinensis TaxID=1130410 RepID=A0ABR1XY10_9PEZI
MAELSEFSTLSPRQSSSPFWLEQITHNGFSPFIANASTYTVFRNVVTDFGADNTGTRDASAAINAAIQAGSVGGRLRSSVAYGSTGQPAVVYLPAGTYLLNGPIQLYIGTVFIGSALSPPTLLVSSSYSGSHVVYAKDPNYVGTTNFYVAMKNIVIDSTAVNPSSQLTLLDWTVSQATQLTNVHFQMPLNSAGHTGLKIGEWPGVAGYNSQLIVNDIYFHGGAVGMNATGQQWLFKGMAFEGCNQAMVIGGFDVVVTHSTFNYCGTCIDASTVSGSLVIIDTVSMNSGNLVYSTNYYTPNGLVIENVVNGGAGATVLLGNQNLLNGNVVDTWFKGNHYAPGDSRHYYTPSGVSSSTRRTTALLYNGRYLALTPPTYAQYSADYFVNIKSVAGAPVYGDGVHDDTAAINAILAAYAGSRIIYWPAGTYVVTGTIFVPAGSRIVGDAFGTAISAYGAAFMDASNPAPMVQIGRPGDVGLAEISDMLFTVAAVLPGCKLVSEPARISLRIPFPPFPFLFSGIVASWDDYQHTTQLEINLSASTPGAVALFNTHFRIGGALGSAVRTSCGSTPGACKAAWGLLHITASGSAYIENMWGWTADHDLDSHLNARNMGYNQTIAVGRGALIEATQGTWLVGTGFEHNTLYQYTFSGARNVYAAMLQTETPYWQGGSGASSSAVAPAPWTANLVPSDPAFGDCAATGDPRCGMAWMLRVNGTPSDLFLYGACLWLFFNDGKPCAAADGYCQLRGAEVAGAKRAFLFGVNTKSVREMITGDAGAVRVTQGDNWGGWGGVVAAYLFNT